MSFAKDTQIAKDIFNYYFKRDYTELTEHHLSFDS